MTSEKPLTLFKLVMMSVVAIDSLKNLSSNALYGSHLIFYYVLATIVFFIPSALVSAELAATWPATGGIYMWVREAFGKQMAFLTIWLQWLVAITWYPAILSFIAATLAYFISVDLAINKIYIFVTIQILFWMAIYFVNMGIGISSFISTISAIIGVIIPMLFFIIFGFLWIYSGHSSQIDLFPSFAESNIINKENLRLFITILYSLMGMELIAVHAGDVKNPQKIYPYALLISACIILATVIPASLAIAMVVPLEKISLTTGVIEAFTIFLQAMHFEWMQPLIVTAVSIGSFGIFLTWLLTATRYLLIATEDGLLPGILHKINRYGMPTIQLLVQGFIFTALSSAFIFMPSVNRAFWFLSAAAAQFALIYYIILFAAALCLRHKYTKIQRPFQVGKHYIILWLICSIAILTCLIAFCFGFLPPLGMTSSEIIRYEILLVGCIFLGCSIGWFIGFIYKNKRYREAEIDHSLEIVL